MGAKNAKCTETPHSDAFIFISGCKLRGEPRWRTNRQTPVVNPTHRIWSSSWIIVSDLCANSSSSLSLSDSASAIWW